jgi:hypothetical protein
MKIGDKVKPRVKIKGVTVVGQVYSTCGIYLANPDYIYTVAMVSNGSFSTIERTLIGSLLIWNISDFEVMETTDSITNLSLIKLNKAFE